MSGLAEAALWLAVAISIPIAVIGSLVYPNVILEQGLSHRIFYFHVPVAWVALYGPILASFFSVIFLISKKSLWDDLAFTSNQISFLFAIGVLFSGPIWAFSAWGVPWDRTDARLQSFFILCLSLVSYFVFRFLILDLKKKAIISSYLSILCALSSVLTWGAIRWIENPGNHPGSVLGKGGMDPDMKITFWFSIFAFHLLFLILFLLTYRTQKILSIRDRIRTEKG
ncbi:cytochrome c biogenesis protein CcsA [Leptospira ognonensis]|uniref:cytochrome c biogenesis protein CcsA n=1 Tax=Leptospira ognonensis TaxID=2484945 RepID=UPI001AEFD423|nr:cytochrome c biogenesis protein CcsA [Leptospira ognonensis]